jgi:hypothetical protein
VQLTGTGVAGLAAVAAGAALLVWVVSRRSAVAAAVNPASPDNLAHRGVNAAGAAVTGDASWTLGGWLAETFSPSVRAANAMNSSPPNAAAPRQSSTGYRVTQPGWYDETDRLMNRYPAPRGDGYTGSW